MPRRFVGPPFVEHRGEGEDVPGPDHVGEAVPRDRAGLYQRVKSLFVHEGKEALLPSELGEGGVDDQPFWSGGGGPARLVRCVQCRRAQDLANPASACVDSAGKRVDAVAQGVQHRPEQLDHLVGVESGLQPFQGEQSEW